MPVRRLLQRRQTALGGEALRAFVLGQLWRQAGRGNWGEAMNIHQLLFAIIGFSVGFILGQGWQIAVKSTFDACIIIAILGGIFAIEACLKKLGEELSLLRELKRMKGGKR
jgi:hypothetical protein